MRNKSQSSDTSPRQLELQQAGHIRYRLYGKLIARFHLFHRQAQPMLPYEQMRLIDDYVDHGNRSIPGFLWQSAAYVTAMLGLKQLQDGTAGNLGEIGVWQGRYLYLLGLLSRPDETVLGIDSFVHSPEPDRFAREVQERFEANDCTQGKIRLLRQDSTSLTPQAVQSFSPGSYRLFSVDGGHLAHEVKSDSELVSQLMAPGGIMILDDIMNNTCPGVIEGTLEFLNSEKGKNFEAFCLVGNKLLVTDKPHAAHYREYLLQMIQENKEVSLFRDTAATIATFPAGVYPRLCGADLVVFTWSGDVLVTDMGSPVLIRTKVCDMSELSSPEVQLPSVVSLAGSTAGLTA